jgi:hypothetical protein
MHSQPAKAFSCPPEYPEVAPQLKLLAPKGIADSALATIRAELEDEISESLGDQML